MTPREVCLSVHPLWSCRCQLPFLPLGPFTQQVLFLLLGSHTLPDSVVHAGGPETHPGLHRAERGQLCGVTKADTSGDSRGLRDEGGALGGHFVKNFGGLWQF